MKTAADKMPKPTYQKSPIEMDFNEFKAWATGYILFGIGEGQTLKSLIHTIVDQAARNEKFGRFPDKNRKDVK
tara:strand:+ start:5963 stop:6181 length:219 start_codon:yes stop_codon:yes gene_type:complete